MLFEDISALELNWTGFNEKEFSVNDLLKIAEHNNIIVLEDGTIDRPACTLIYKNKKFIYYNPCESKTDLILALGHELGHIGLGHVTSDKILYSDTFAKSGIEKDAGIVGFLFWHPSLELYKLDLEGRLDIEEVYKYHKNTNGRDLLEDDLMRLCMSRLRIYKGLRRTWSRPPRVP